MYLNNKICDIIYDKIKKSGIETDYELFSYGYKVMVGYILILITISMIGIILNCLMNIYIFVILFSILRKQLGGFHFDSSILCFIFSIIFSILIPYIAKNTYLIPINHIIFTFIFLIIITNVIGVIDNKNKKLTDDEKKIFKRKSIIVECVYFIICVVANIYNLNYFSNVILFTVMFCVLGNCIMYFKMYIMK